MFDFFIIATRQSGKKDAQCLEIYPKFIIKKSDDLMIRGGDFYAIWLEDENRWSTDEQDAISRIDRALDTYKAEHTDSFEYPIKVLHLWDAESGIIDKWHKYCQQQMRDNFHPLDETLIFANTPTKKENYASKTLPYSLEDCDISAYDKLVSTLYSPDNRHKIEWAIGSIVSGESKNIQKFLVLYGSAGTGKSTVLNIIQQLFEGYYSVFDARALGSASNSFALEAFKANPLVAIQHDGDLSRIEDNTRLNSLVSHELMTVNEKFKSTYSTRFNAFLFMGTNKPVKITDSKSGLIRRLIDVEPTGQKIPVKEYHRLMSQINFELGGIAQHCLDVYLSDKGAFDDYIPVSMMGASNDFYNFMLDAYYTFMQSDGVTLKSAWSMYKNYCEEANVPYPYSQRVFKEELKTYFSKYDERITLSDGTRARSYFSGFRTERFEQIREDEVPEPKIEFVTEKSLFDTECADCPAQYAKTDGSPNTSWSRVTTTLKDLDTSKLHYVRVPENHIVIDFDLKNKNGEKDFKLNLEAASKWPKTYAELSKSGAGIHLHYIYNGDVSKLSRIYDTDIEVKVFSGKSSLRRRLTKCSNNPIATISSGLPLKEAKRVVNENVITNERTIRKQIAQNLRKEVHANTKPSVDFIKKILDEAYASGVSYDVSDLRNNIINFAASSTHQSGACLDLVSKMHFTSDDVAQTHAKRDEIVFYDIEVYQNLFIVCWKYAGPEHTVVKMRNPSPEAIEELCGAKLIGFNNRKYDNHILYARMMGYSNEQLYNLSQRIISGKDRNAFFGEAYNLSYTDVFDFSSKKQSLKKWEIELGIHHQEMGIPWDEPVPEDMVEKVEGYCANDVLATEAVFNHIKADFVAREILADLAGGTVNDTTNSLTTKIIFGNERHPQLVYTDLATGKQDPDYLADHTHKHINAFPGYSYEYDSETKKYKNTYRGDNLGHGGWVYAVPGMYTNVALLDVASLHPHSAVELSYFGKYTQNFKDLMDARIYIKHGDYEKAKELFDGKLAPYLNDPEMATALAFALKIAINSVYGLTSAGFVNPFRDERNKNNIVALRGALFMRLLQDEVTARGFTVAHIKTDSIKIPEATPDIIQFCMDFAKKYGYTFEHEATYEKMCLVNDAVYIAKYSDDKGINGKHAGQWTATGTQFQVPYVFKTLFSKEPITFDDVCETKSVTQGSLYLDFNEGYTIQTEVEKEIKDRASLVKKPDFLGYKNPAFKNVSNDELTRIAEKGHNCQFVGRVGLFTPVKPGYGGGTLYRYDKNKYNAAAGTKGYRWLESEEIRGKNDVMDIVDLSYYNNLVDDAVANISQYGDFEWFHSDNKE